MWIAWLMTDRITALADRPSYTLSNSGALIISVLHSLLKVFPWFFLLSSRKSCSLRNNHSDSGSLLPFEDLQVLPIELICSTNRQNRAAIDPSSK